ncbi:MAG: CBS domain-containing protein [Cyanobacteria bacterium J06621_3]
MITVADIMSSRVFTIRSSAKVTQAIALMQAHKVRSLVVEKAVKEGAYGIVTERDIAYKVIATSADPLHVMVCEIMESPCIQLSADLSLREAAKRFREANIQQAPVVDNKRLMGTVAIADIIRSTNVEDVHLPADWAQQAETALRHKRLCWGDDCQLEEESEVARGVLLELQSSA